MPIRRALVRAAIMLTVLMALASVALYAVREQLPQGGGLKLLAEVSVGDPMEEPRICLMTDCDNTDDAYRFCFMQQDRLRDSSTDCSRLPLRIQLVQPPSLWPMRPGAPL